MKPLIIAESGSLTISEKRKLCDNGYLVIETNPNSLVFKPVASQLQYATCASCKELVYMTKERKDYLLNSGETFFCTHGHKSFYSNSSKTNSR